MLGKPHMLYGARVFLTKGDDVPHGKAWTCALVYEVTSANTGTFGQPTWASRFPRATGATPKEACEAFDRMWLGQPMKAFHLIREERVRQDEQWGGPKHDDQHCAADWSDYITHQLTKLDKYVGLEDGRERFVKIAALAVAALEAADRNHPSR